MRKRNIVVLVAVGILVVIQFVPVDRSNPPVRGEINAPDSVLSIIRKSCYDCHSNETQWPWYGYVAPVSWLLAHDVHEGRGKLNFSTWSEFSDLKQSVLLLNIREQTSEGKMPLPGYSLLHRDAKLGAAALETLRRWTESPDAAGGEAGERTPEQTQGN